MANNKFCIVGIAVIALLLTFASSKKLQETRGILIIIVLIISFITIS